MTNQTKNPAFWCLVSFVVGMGLGAWGLIKSDCISGPGCWVGSGFLKITGIVLIALGAAGWAIMSNKPRSNK